MKALLIKEECKTCGSSGDLNDDKVCWDCALEEMREDGQC